MTFRRRTQATQVSFAGEEAGLSVPHTILQSPAGLPLTRPYGTPRAEVLVPLLLAARPPGAEGRVRKGEEWCEGTGGRHNHQSYRYGASIVIATRLHSVSLTEVCVAVREHFPKGVQAGWL